MFVPIYYLAMNFRQSQIVYRYVAHMIVLPVKDFLTTLVEINVLWIDFVIRT